MPRLVQNLTTGSFAERVHTACAIQLVTGRNESDVFLDSLRESGDTSSGFDPFLVAVHGLRDALLGVEPEASVQHLLAPRQPEERLAATLALIEHPHRDAVRRLASALSDDEDDAVRHAVQRWRWALGLVEREEARLPDDPGARAGREADAHADEVRPFAPRRVSLVTNFRHQFDSLLSQGGPEYLLELLRKKNAEAESVADAAD